MNRRSIGAQGEADAKAFLLQKGAKILEANYRRPTGEIDIIARQGKTLLFVEVKRRSSLVDRQKQSHILRTAQLYMQENRLTDVPVRFDVIEVLPGQIRHIENAFDASAIR